MRYFLLAGEASGDNLGALLATGIRERDPDAEFAFWGGEALAAATGLPPKRHLRELAFMGFVEVAANLRTIRGLERAAREDVAAFAPDALVLVDYPGFNLRLGRWARRRGIRVEFYVSPQIWAWRRRRVHRVVRSFDRLLCILPFEPGFYASFGYDAAAGYDIRYTGHPLPRRVDGHEPPPRLIVSVAGGTREIGPGERVVALLPGSRRQEVARMIPLMAAAVGELRARGVACVPVVGAAPVLAEADLRQLGVDHNLGWTRATYDLLAHAHVACVASGTATLETALFGVPQVVCYRGSTVSVAIARRLVDVEHIALANVILGREVIPELIQGEATPQEVARVLGSLWDGPRREAQRAGYHELRERLLPYAAAESAAAAIVDAARSAR